MKVLFLDAYFEPEQIAFTHLERDLLEKLVGDSHDITVICPTPTRGIDETTVKEYKKRKNEELFAGHIHVKRFSAPQEGRNPLIRAFRYFWCNLRTYQMGKQVRDCDLVFCNSTPPTQGWIAGRVARILKVPFVYSLQDIFPDSLVTTGMTKKNSLLWKIGRNLEKKTYQHCSKIVVISEAMKQNLIEKNVEKEKICLISNWIDINTIKQIDKKDNKLFDEFNIDRSKFIIVYAGNFGEAQGAEIVIYAAERLQNRGDIQFVIFGGGSGYEKACQLSENLKNVFIHPLMPQSRIAEVYSMGDIALITARKGVGKSGMPSKMWSIMACDVPIVASFDKDSELAEIMQRSEAGVCAEPENVEELVSAIIKVKDKTEKYTGGRNYLIQNVSKDICLERYANLMQNETRTRK